MKINVNEISGCWDLGYSLDKHSIKSEFAGHNESGHPIYNTTRSEAGEALYQLKYMENFEYSTYIAEEIFNSIVRPFFKTVKMIIPMPPSKSRERQPVFEICSDLSKIMSVNFFTNILLKKPEMSGVQIKDIEDKEEKQKLLENIFYIDDRIKNKGCWDALVIDDIFSSGASMEAACSTLRKYSKINNIYVATVTRRYG